MVIPCYPLKMLLCFSLAQITWLILYNQPALNLIWKTFAIANNMASIERRSVSSRYHSNKMFGSKRYGALANGDENENATKR